MATEKAAVKIYRGNCHCGEFIFNVKAAELNSVTECNCSICFKKGYLWFNPSEPMTIIKGDGSLKEYTFGLGRMVHMFCRICATPLMARAGHNVIINARVIQGLDCWKLEVDKFDGQNAHTGYTYIPPVFTGPEPSAAVEGGKIYKGSCHCGAVTIAIKVKPLDSSYTDKILECNCSICQRGGYVWVYTTTDQVSVQGRESLSYYTFGTHNLRKAFCTECGVQILNEVNPLTDKEVAALSTEGKSIRAIVLNYRSVTLRALNNFDLGSIKVGKNDGWSLLKPYINP